MHRFRQLATRMGRALPRRGGGGHGHGHAHHEAGHGHGAGDHHMSEAAARYEAEVPRLFGEPALPAGGRRVMEDWEPSFYWLVAGTAALVALGAYRPNNNPRDWAADEAAERMRRREAGLPVEMGVNYSALRFMKEHHSITEEQAEALEGGAAPARYLPPVHRP